MSRKIAILIAVERYLNPGIDPVKYAGNDARELSKALALHGFNDVDQVLLINEQSTKTTIVSRVRMETKRLQPTDTFYLFFAGHGFSKNGDNFLTCYDTHLEDIENTSINLRELIDFIGNSSSRHVALFLDGSAGGLTKEPLLSPALSGMNSHELEETLQRAPHCVCFTSCEGDQASYPAVSLKHGIWTSHIIQALTGQALQAADSDYTITAPSLQRYLAKAIPEDVRNLFITERHCQTPRMFGSIADDFSVASIEPIVSKRRTETSLAPGAIQRLLLQTIAYKKIKLMTGYKSSSQPVPKVADSWSDKFVKKLAEIDLHEELNDLASNARALFKFKRKDLSSVIDFGCGSIVTSKFEYYIEISQDPADPSSALLKRSLSKLSAIEAGDVEKLDQLFPGSFDTVVFEFEKAPNITDIIDQLEEDDTSEWGVAYALDFSECTLKKGDLSILIAGDRMQFNLGTKRNPSHLLKEFHGIAGLLGSGALSGLLT
ncbi:MAG: caspase family protein [Candidatus Sericytochromatia bacterium]|nr:caspase family protein [Candidatus Sericytochromatia bacterium]